MISSPGILELIDVDPSRFDELDVARLVAQLGGSMFGNQIVFADSSRLSAAIDVLFERFGARYFSRADDSAPQLDNVLELSNV